MVHSQCMELAQMALSLAPEAEKYQHDAFGFVFSSEAIHRWFLSISEDVSRANILEGGLA